MLILQIPSISTLIISHRTGIMFYGVPILLEGPATIWGLGRLSYGILGSDKISDYQYISQLSGEATYVLDGILVNGNAVGASPNPSVKWEESEQFDVGADFKFLRNRIDVNADYFIKTTNNLLIGNIPVSGILGVTAPGAAGPTANAGTVRNSGFEFAIGYRGNITEDFSYRLNYNLTTLKFAITTEQINNNRL